MVKGVNKQIIEVVNTEDAFFEKAILFVNPEKIGIGEDMKLRKADQYVKKLSEQQKKQKLRSAIGWRILKFGGAAAAGAAVATLLIRL